jgi:dihydrofolate synthase/folylpolyglutamate synthase
MDFESITIQNDDDSINDDYFCLNYNYKNTIRDIILCKPSLKGDHQLINLSCVIVGLLEAGVINEDTNFEKIHKAILNTKWPARLEVIYLKHLMDLLPKNSRIIFDGAHNQGGARVIADYIKTLPNTHQNYLIIARSKDTDSAIFANEFAGERLLEAVFAVRCHGEVKPENEQNIYNQIVNSQNSFFNKNNTFTCCNFVQALSKIAKITNNKPCRVFICGSLYMARDIFVLSKKLKWVEALAVDIL